MTRVLIIVWTITCLNGQANAVLFSTCDHHQQQHQESVQKVEKIAHHHMQQMQMNHAQHINHHDTADATDHSKKAKTATSAHNHEKGECCGKAFCQCMDHACGVSGSSAALVNLTLPVMVANNVKIQTGFDSWTAIPRDHLLHVPIV